MAVARRLGPRGKASRTIHKISSLASLHLISRVYIHEGEFLLLEIKYEYSPPCFRSAMLRQRTQNSLRFKTRTESYKLSVTESRVNPR